MESAADRDRKGIPAEYAAVLTHAAFVLACGLVLGRLMMVEAARDAMPVVAGQTAVPLGAGAATGLVLDWLMVLPAVLVLARRLIDPTYALRGTVVMVPLALLAGWICLSLAWSHDGFLTLVNAGHFVGAAALFWAMTQLVRTWKRLRLVAGVGIGMLLILSAKSVYWRTLDLPDAQANFQENRETFFAERGQDPDSVQARQFEGKIMRGEMIGYSVSSNVHGALLVMGSLIALGAAGQRLRHRDLWGFPLALIVGVPVALWAIYYTQSKAAWAALLIGGVGWAIWWLAGQALARRPRLVFGGAIGLFFLGLAAVGAYGASTGTLPIDSLRFRWAYWTGSAAMAADHPVGGVGWAAFADPYLLHRPPGAPEEVNDPHNALMKLLAELGFVGLFLGLIVGLRLAWEAVRPTVPPTGKGTKRELIAVAVWVPIVAWAVAMLAGVDLVILPAFAVLQGLERLLYVGLAGMAIALCAVRSVEEPVADGRAAPLLAAGVAAALGVFVVQSMLDVMLFQPASLGMVALLAGALVGLRTPSVAGKKLVPWVNEAALTLVLAGLLASAALVVGPTVMAANATHAADAALRRGEFATAYTKYKEAAGWLPVADELLLRRTATAAQLANRPIEEIRGRLDDAAAARPAGSGPQWRIAGFEQQLPAGVRDTRRELAALGRAIDRNRSDPAIRRDYADVLRDYGMPSDARTQYEAALRLNDAYDENEIERFPQAEVERIERILAAE
jgi:hypothetical protein